MKLDESWEARVCVRLFSTFMPRSNENKSCMRVDESWWELRSESLDESFLNSHASVQREEELHKSWWELRSESLHESFFNSRAPVKREQFKLHESWLVITSQSSKNSSKFEAAQIWRESMKVGGQMRTGFATLILVWSMLWAFGSRCVGVPESFSCLYFPCLLYIRVIGRSLIINKVSSWVTRHILMFVGSTWIFWESSGYFWSSTAITGFRCFFLRQENIRAGFSHFWSVLQTGKQWTCRLKGGLMNSSFRQEALIEMGGGSFEGDIDRGNWSIVSLRSRRYFRGEGEGGRS
jgi:hypothetical protein